MPDRLGLVYDNNRQCFVFSGRVLTPINALNTRQGWDDAMIAANQDLLCHLYETSILSDSTDPRNNVLNLQYFILHADRLLAQAQLRAKGNRTTRIALLIHTDLNNSYAIKSYLYFQAIRKNAIIFWMQIDDMKPRQYTLNRKNFDQMLEINFGRIPPLLTVGDGFDAMTLTQLTSPVMNLHEWLKNCLSCVAEKVQSAQKWDETEIRSVFKERISEYFDFVNRIDGVTLMTYICLTALLKVACFRGTHDQSLDYNAKVKLMLQYADMLPRTIEHMSIFQLYVFCYCLSPLGQQNEIVASEEQTECLDDSVLQKCVFDAGRYADGLYQIIENACFHSQGKRAYVSLRLFETLIAPGATVKQLHKRLRQRELMAWSLNEYASNPDIYRYTYNNTARYYLYAQVTDDCLDTTGNTKGMLKCFSGMSEVNKSVTDLHGIFNRTIHDNDVIWHCGLQLFCNTVTGYQGYFSLASPGKTDSESFLCQYQEVQKGLCKSLHQTCYQIALPMSYRIQQQSDVLYATKVPTDCQDVKRYLVRQNQSTDVPNVIDFTSRFINIQGRSKQEDTQAYGTVGQKEALVKQYISNIMPKELDGSARLPFSPDEIHCIFAGEDQNAYDAELIAKAVLACIMESRDVKHDQSLLLIALYFYQSGEIIRFINSFLAFYGKGRTLGAMDNTQIALCLRNKSDQEKTDGKASDDPLQICFVISGSSLNAVRANAEQYVMSNVQEFLPYAPMLRHMLSMPSDMKPFSAKLLFPFELYLIKRKNFYYEDSQTSKVYAPRIRNQNCCFLDTIERIIQKPLQETDYGCALKDCHFQLGSKVHTDAFYEVELLFHNALHVYQFAYYLVRDILLHYQQAQKALPKRLILIGYEAYSGILMEQVRQLLDSCSLKSTIHTAIFTNDSNGVDQLFFSSAFNGIALDEQNNILKSAEYIAIIPIGSTLTTVYKVKNITTRTVYARTEKTPDFTLFYTLIVVAPEQNDDSVQLRFGFDSKLEGVASECLVRKYWEPVRNTRGTSEENVLHLMSEQSGIPGEDNDDGLKVRYLLHVKTKWYDPIDCALCNLTPPATQEEPKVLVHVDKTSTVPNQIFMKVNSNYISLDCFIEMQAVEFKRSKVAALAENLARLDSLQSCVVYGHTYRKSNHFQYNIDCLAYFHQASGQAAQRRKASGMPKQNVMQWLQDMSVNIDHDGYNVIISPLNPNNSPFLCAVIDHAFHKNVRLLYLPVDSVYQEEVRAKYSVISAEYNEIRLKQPSVGIYFHFVDDIIVTGATIYRAANLIRTLIIESQTDFCDIRLFSRVFLLINRSSYNTMSSFVRTPSKEFFAYLHLSVPSYNTYNDHCPACDLVARYGLLIKRSTSYEITSEFYRLKAKHSKRDIDGEQQWLKSECTHSHGYYSWLKQWLHAYGDRNNKEVDALMQRIRKIGWETLKNARTKSDGTNILAYYLSDSAQQRLNKLDKDSIEMGLRILRKQVIAGRDFCRLRTSHNAHTRLLPLAREAANEQELIRMAKDVMLKLIIDELQGKELSEQAEWLISYIKIFSREPLAKYHHIRQAVYTILFTLLCRMLNNNSSFSEQHEHDTQYNAILKMLGELHPTLYFQVLITVLRRLSDLKCRYLLRSDCICNVWKKWQNLRAQYKTFLLSDVTRDERQEGDDRFLFYQLPTNGQMVFMIVKYLKWLITMDEDETASQIAEEQCREILLSTLRTENRELDEAVRIIAKKLYLENTRIIFGGVEELMDQDDVHAIQKRLRYATRHSAVYGYKNFLATQKAKNSDDAFWGDTCATIAYMTKYFRVSKGLCDRKPEQLPYAYSFICTYIKSISGYEHCSLVYYCDRAAKCLAFSSGKPSSEPVSESDMSAIIGVHQQSVKSTEADKAFLFDAAAEMQESIIVQNWCRPSANNGQKVSKRFMLLHIGFPQVDIESIPDGNVYILLEKKCDNANTQSTEASSESLMRELVVPAQQCEHSDVRSENDIFDPTMQELNIARNILFLRDRLTTRLAKDLYTLLDMRHEYSYVLPYREAKATEDKALFKNDRKEKPDITMLHLSDLHIKYNQKERLKEQVALLNINVNGKDSTMPDLILITGDVVQANTAAGNLEENYDAAKEIIEQIAYKVWGDEILFDWRKRILIISGNHDYASMNELESQFSARMTELGKPARKEGGTMAKFAYYLDFLRKLLRMNVGYLIDQRLNEERAYDAMGCTVIMLNSVAEANAIRNNKVHFAETHVKSLIEKRSSITDGSGRTICMVHHTPIYKINYLVDQYYNKMYLDHMDDFYAVCDALLEFAFAIGDNQSPNIIQDKKNKLANSNNALLGKEEKRKGTPLDQDIAYLLAHHDERHNERVLAISSRIRNDYNMSVADADTYKSLMQNLIKKRNVSLVLGGHTHMAHECDDSAQVPKVYEGGRFFSEDSKNAVSLHFSIATLSNDSTKYVFYQIAGTPLSTSKETAKPSKMWQSLSHVEHISSTIE